MGRHGSDSGFLHESPLEDTCWRCYIWNKIIVDSWSLPIQCCVLVSSPIQDLHSFLHSLEVQTDPVLSVWLQVFFCSRQLSPQAAGQRISSSLETSSCVRGYSFPSDEVNTPKHITGPTMTIRCIKTRRTTQWSGLSGCGAVCLDWGCCQETLWWNFMLKNVLLIQRPLWQQFCLFAYCQNDPYWQNRIDDLPLLKSQRLHGDSFRIPLVHDWGLSSNFSFISASEVEIDRYGMIKLTCFTNE